MKRRESEKSASPYFLYHSLPYLISQRLRIFSKALKKHAELRVPKLRLQPAPLRNLPTWQTDLSIVVLEMESYSAGDLDMEHDEEEEPEEE
jgi:hypothetical protein